MIEYSEILLGRVTRALVGVRNSRKDPHRRSRTAMAAADFYFATREAAIRREERAAIEDNFALNVLLASRERSARRELQQQVIAACLKIARKHHRARQVASSTAAMECVEAVRALLPEWGDPI